MISTALVNGHTYVTRKYTVKLSEYKSLSYNYQTSWCTHSV